MTVRWKRRTAWLEQMTAKGKAGKKECACTLNLDFDGVCENQPWFYWVKFTLAGYEYRCERFTNALTGTNADGSPGYV